MVQKVARTLRDHGQYLSLANWKILSVNPEENWHLFQIRERYSSERGGMGFAFNQLCPTLTPTIKWSLTSVNIIN